MIRLRTGILAMALLMAVSAPNAFAAQKAKDAKDTKDAKASAKQPEIVLRVNNFEITQENFDNVVGELIPVSAFHTSISEHKLREIKKSALDRIINRELIYEAAKEAKDTDVSKKDIDKALDDIKKRIPKGQSLDKILKAGNMTMADLKDELKKKTATDNYTKKKIDEFKKKAADAVNDEFLKSYYDKNMEKFKEPEQIQLRSILVKADPSGGQKVWNEALKKTKEILAKTRAGEDFAKLATQYSEDPYAKNGGDMGWSHRGSLFEEINDAVANLKAGEISEPVMTIYGYHLMKVEGIKPAVQRKFEEINKAKLKSELEPKEFKRLWDDWIKSLKDKAKIEYVSKEMQDLLDLPK